MIKRLIRIYNIKAAGDAGKMDKVIKNFEYTVPDVNVDNYRVVAEYTYNENTVSSLRKWKVDYESLTFGKNISASSEVNPSANAIDRNLRTRWTSSSTDDNAYITVDLEKINILERVKIKWIWAMYAEEYDIQVSDNGSDFTTIYSGGAATSGRQVIELPDGSSGRYVRLQCRKMTASGGTKWGYSINEFDVLGMQDGIQTTCSLNGKTITSMAAGDITVKSNIQGYKGTWVATHYNNENKLIDICIVDVDTQTGSDEVSIKFNNCINTDKIKVLFWEGLSNMMPIRERYILQ